MNEKLIDRLICQIKKDMEMGDVTVLSELLEMLPKENLVQALPEEEWAIYRD